MVQINHHAGIVSDELSHGQRLIWLNFKYYAAVLFWFALLGAFGAIAYAMLRQLAEPVTYLDVERAEHAADKTAAVAAETDEVVADAAVEAAADLDGVDATFCSTSEQADAPESAFTAQDQSSIDQQQRVQGFAADLSHWADWLPVRLFGLGFALVGYFSKASAALIAYLVDSSTPAEIVLADIAKAAEPLPDELRNCSSEACSLVQLSKRNILFFLALVAVLTLSGLLS
jgi:AmpE protein